MAVSNGGLALITNANLFLLKKSMMSGHWEVEWDVSWANCKTVVREDTRIRIILKVNVHKH